MIVLIVMEKDILSNYEYRETKGNINMFTEGVNAAGKNKNTLFCETMKEWHPILYLIGETGISSSRLIEKLKFKACIENKAIKFNKTRTLKLADSLEKIIKNKRSNEIIYAENYYDKLIYEDLINSVMYRTINNLFHTDVEMVHQFINFCRKSNGFKISYWQF